MDPLYGYRGLARRILENAKVEIGDRVRIESKKFKVEGILMPRPELASENYLTIKLDNGYNIGVRVDPDIKVSLVERGSRKIGLRLEEPIRIPEKLPLISIVSTGGTIASRVDYRTGAVHPALSSRDLVSLYPEILESARVDSEILYSILSENMHPKYWSKIAERIYGKILEGAEGVVVTHGTDTMAYTAAALAFSLRELPKPVILVGSQRSSDRPSSDAYLNLMWAVKVAAEAPISEVLVVMHGSSSDNIGYIHRGVKVRKLHTSRRDAFQSVNSKPLAVIRDDGKIQLLTREYKKRRRDVKGFELVNRFEERVFLLKSYPGISGEIIEYLVDKGYKGIVLEGTGLGHFPEYTFKAIERGVEEGVVFVMTSQCLWGRVNMNVYSTGRKLLSLGVIPGEDMLPEVALVKLMWALGQTSDVEEVRRIMLTNIAGEISDRSLTTVFPFKEELQSGR